MRDSSSAGKKQKTRESIIRVFLEVYETTPYDQLSVKDISKKAGISRGTFYLHFLDLEDLITSVEDKYLNEMRKQNKQNRYYHLSTDRDDVVTFFTLALRYIDENRYAFSVLLGPNAHPRFRIEIESIMRDNVVQRCDTVLQKLKWDDFNKFIIEIIIAGNMGILTNWVSGERGKSPEEVAEQFVHILENLPYASIHKRQKREAPSE